MNRARYKKSRANISRRKTIVPRAKSQTPKQSETFKQTLKLVKQVNNRLSKLTQEGYTSGSWSSKKLKNRLSTSKIGAWHRGRVKINENMTETELKAVQKASQQFLASKTSTKKGIEKQIKNTKKSIITTLSDEDGNKVTDEDAEFYFDMLGESDFDFFADKIGASTLWALISDAIEQNDSVDSWIDRLERYITLNDEDIRNRAINLYNKYI